MSKRLVFLLVTALLAVFFTACSNSTNQQEKSSVEDKQSNGPRVVKDMFGEVTMPTVSKNMLVTNSRYAEYLIEMGITPQMVFFIAEIEPAYRAPYFEKHGVKMIRHAQYELNYEQLLGLSPDLIVSQGEGLELNNYEALTKIAPTIAVDAGPGMYDAMPKLAKLFEKEEESAQALAIFDKKAAKAKEEIHQAIGDKTVFVLRVDPKQYRYLGSQAGESSKLLYQTLGLKIPEIFNDSKDWFTPFSLEILPDIKADFIFLEKRKMENYDSTDAMEALENNFLWKSMDAVKNNHVFELKTSDFIQGEGPVGSSLLVDYIVEKLVP